ncbi:Cytidylate kinase [invertebrate metagenome]|uniref:(d)CMP kinase n=1 Tax=invertebrate metagenome TaxID=1711999 RepID=A0A2H9T8N6_9ZZZZ
MIADTSPMIVTIDGPSGSGKGTAASLLASHLKWHLLDSGALYRLTAMAVLKHKVDINDAKAVAERALHLDVGFTYNEQTREVDIIFESEPVGAQLRTEIMGAYASQVAVLPEVRQALLQRQRDFAISPGLVADGRDMGTVVFSEAKVKIFLTASAEERARRRVRQLQMKGIDVNFDSLLNDIRARDERDTHRSVAPLVPADDAVIIDSTKLSISQVVSCLITEVKKVYAL